MAHEANSNVAVFAGQPGNSPAKGNQTRFVQRHERPAASLHGSQKLLGWTSKVERKPGSKSAARVAGLYEEANRGKTLAELWAARPECRKDLLWDYQHGHLELSPAPAA